MENLGGDRPLLAIAKSWKGLQGVPSVSCCCALIRYIQQLREGVPNFFATFIEVRRDRPPGHDWELELGVTCGDYLFGMLQGTRSALYANKRQSITVTISEVDPKTVGGGVMVALYEHAVRLYAIIVNINAYHQPGVEAGKKAAAEVLALQKRVLSVLNDASCRDPVEALSVEEIARRCPVPNHVRCGDGRQDYFLHGSK